MNNKYNLSDNVEDDFGFVLNGQAYRMRYPITEEVEKIQELTVELEQAQENKDKDEETRLNKALENYLYSFITPQGHQTEIQTVLKKANIKTMRNFNKMIKAELSIQ